jgi:hypothetical protein
MNEDRVQERLRELRESMSQMEAPEAIEAAVLAVFREHARPRPASRVRPVWRWAMAACVAALALLGAWRITQVEPTRVAIADPPRPLAPKAPAIDSSRPNRQDRKGGIVHARVRPAPQRAPQRNEPDPDATAFVALPFAPPVAPSEDQQVVRVRLPRGAMRQFGVMVREDRVREPVQADFLLGQDGIARAVRLVSSAQ